MMASSNGKCFRVTGPLCGEFTGHRWIPLTKASDAEFWYFSLIWAWTNSYVKNRNAGDLRRHLAHYNVTVMRRWHNRYPSIRLRHTHREQLCQFNLYGQGTYTESMESSETGQTDLYHSTWIFQCNINCYCGVFVRVCFIKTHPPLFLYFTYTKPANHSSSICYGIMSTFLHL